MYMPKFAIIDAPSSAKYVGRVDPSSPYNPERDSSTLLLNAKAIREFSLVLCRTVSSVLSKKLFPIIIGTYLS